MIVKICGITRTEDAALAVELGALAIGFIFWPSSPRVVSPARARDIVTRLPPQVLAVGVFVNASAATIEATVDEAGLGAIQLHGDESPVLAKGLSRPVIKALTLGPALDDQLEAWRESTVLLDAHDATHRGGTGRTIDWDRAATVAARHRVLLAGGLNAGNVAVAVSRVRPAGIDVSSGVESSPGVKDADKLRALFGALAGMEAVQ